MRSTRRTFLEASGLVALGGLWPGAARWAAAQGSAFTGREAGDARTVSGIRLRWCPPGRFRMGSPLDEAGRRADEAPVEVMLTRGFWMGQHEVTQAQWQRVMGTFPVRARTTAWGLGDEYPAYWVSFDDAETFCRTLTARSHEARQLPRDWAFAIPTEAQWEYACRAGTTTATAFGDRLTTVQANFDPDADTRAARLAGGSRPVGSYPANAWGLLDMHGNVWEWCRDYYHARLPGGVDPDLSTVLGVQNGDGSYSRVRRGGAWIESGWACRSACRLRYESHRASDHIGFRVTVAPARA